MDAATLILGCGYTGTRLARELRRRGQTVFATARDPRRFAPLAALGVEAHRLERGDPASVDALLDALPARLRVVHSIPPWRGEDGSEDPTPRLLATLRPRVRRWVYLSSTGVYGAAQAVDETTPAAPSMPRQVARHEAEQQVLALPAPSLILRAPAIYGPFRGVHALLRAGRYRLVGRGENVGSRIHVDDLVEHVRAGLVADLEGSWPLADALATTAREIAAFCAQVLGCPRPPSVTAAEVGETQRTTRRVDGRAIRSRLGIGLRYPTYREGIRAALAEEAGA